jgi:hypothetical protein
MVAFAQNTRDEVREMAVVGALASQPGMKQTSYIRQSHEVRRLTPTECERLQGFPDDHTLIPWRGKMAPDGPRYKALGNSMAVPVMRWIGERISQMNSVIRSVGGWATTADFGEKNPDEFSRMTVKPMDCDDSNRYLISTMSEWEITAWEGVLVSCSFVKASVTITDG